MPTPSLADLHDLMGTISDGEIADKAGVKRWEVGKYRREHGIPAYRGYLFEGGEGEAPAKKAAVKKAAAEPAAKRGRRSKLDPFRDMLGKVPDQEVARKAGVSLSNVRQYRYRHEIKLELKKAAEPEAEVKAAQPAPAPEVAEPVAEVAAAQPAPAPVEAKVEVVQLLGFSVHVEGMDEVYHTIAEDIAAAARRAQAAVAERHPGATVAEVREMGPALG